MPERRLTAEVLEDLRAALPDVAEKTVAAVTAEVPDYADAFRGEMGATLQGAVQTALSGFLRLAGRTGHGSPLGPAREAAYALGRGEARSGRTAVALLSAYRVGARVAWREMSAIAVRSGLEARTVAHFAALVFAYIDELSVASVAGHTDELATSGRVREQNRERLGAALLSGMAEEDLLVLAARADWAPPPTLTVVLVPDAQVRAGLPSLPPQALHVPGELLQVHLADVVLVPGPRRSLLRTLHGRQVVVGPSRPWTAAASSYARAIRAHDLDVGTPLDTETHLTDLVLTADPEALADLRAAALEPLADLSAATAERLAETLRAWLLHQGRREEVAAALHIHPQTVRYRMGQLRECFGSRLTEPESVLQLTIALCRPAAPDR